MKLDASFSAVALAAIGVSAKRVTSRNIWANSEKPSLLGPPSPSASVSVAAMFSRDKSFNFGADCHPKETGAGS